MAEQIQSIQNSEPRSAEALPKYGAGQQVCHSLEDGWSGIYTAPAEELRLHSSEEADKIRGYFALYAQRLGGSAIKAA